MATQRRRRKTASEKIAEAATRDTQNTIIKFLRNTEDTLLKDPRDKIMMEVAARCVMMTDIQQMATFIHEEITASFLARYGNQKPISVVPSDVADAADALADSV